jgi:hypothetical protein
MSTYAVNLVARRALKEPGFRDSLKADPAAALAGFDLTEAEQQALLAGDVAALYASGAHDYMLMSLARCEVLGLDIPTFSERIRSATPRLIY